MRGAFEGITVRESLNNLEHMPQRSPAEGTQRGEVLQSRSEAFERFARIEEEREKILQLCELLNSLPATEARGLAA